MNCQSLVHSSNPEFKTGELILPGNVAGVTPILHKISWVPDEPYSHGEMVEPRHLEDHSSLGPQARVRRGLYVVY